MSMTQHLPPVEYLPCWKCGETLFEVVVTEKDHRLQCYQCLAGTHTYPRILHAYPETETKAVQEQEDSGSL